MLRTGLLIAATALVLNFALSLPVQAEDDRTASKLEITAQSDIKAVPDIATINAGVNTNAPTTAAAMQENATKMTAVFKAIKDSNIADKDIQTSGLNVNAMYSYNDNEQRLTGYQATNTVNVNVRDIAKIGALVDAMVTAGANTINSIQFSVENPDPLLDTARADAVKKARARAEIYAGAAGMKIARITLISEQTSFQPSPWPMMRAMSMDAGGAAASTPVAPGQIGLTVTVNVSFEME